MREPNLITSCWKHRKETTLKHNILSVQYVLVSQGFYNKVPRTWWLKQQKFTLSRLWSLEVGNQGIGRICTSRGSEGESVPCFSFSFCYCQQSLAFLGLWHHRSNLCLRHHIAFSLCIFTSSFLCAYLFLCVFSSSKDASRTELRAHPTPE